jgi:Na+-transporting NADH:ubiquinone oxidoreductase subunit A
VHIKIKKGLDIPIAGKPKGKAQTFVHGGETVARTPSFLALNLEPFEDVNFKLLTKVGDKVKIGQGLAEDKSTPGRNFVSPATGTITELRRGLKRRLLDVVIQVDRDEQYFPYSTLDIQRANREDIVKTLMAGGIFANIRSRPFGKLANPNQIPRNIFVKAVESAPFIPPAEFQVEGYEREFQAGLTALSKLTQGKVHLVYHRDTTSSAFTNATHVEKHTVEGPHPVSNYSLHIQEIDPVQNYEDVIWTLNAHDVVCIGSLLTHGKVHIEKVIGIGGPGIPPERTGYFKIREGYPIESLISNRLDRGAVRLVSGDPLMGKKVEPNDFLGYSHYAFCAIPEKTEREFLHFFRLGLNKYSFSGAYLSGHLDSTNREYAMTTNLHGEERAFIDGSLYDKVNPLNVPTMTLVKSVMAEDYDRAHELGLLDVDSEDFALPTFVCPSKMEMTDIIKRGLQTNAAEIFG